MGKVQIILAQRLLDPVWNADQRRAVDVVTHAIVHMRTDDGMRRETFDDHTRNCGLSHIMADSRQIMWRKFLRSLCKYNTMEQPVLPHNVAWPFSAFLPSWCYALFAATLCGRKRVLTLNLASILRKMVLPDNMAL